MPANRIEGRTDVFADWAWQALLVSGACSVVLGAVVLAWPDKSETISGTLFGLVLVATAATQFVVAFGAHIAGGLKWLEFFGGALALLLAVWCFGSGQWVVLLALWTGLGWMIRGILQAIVAAWSERFAGAGRQEIIGLLTMIAGLVVALGLFESMTALSIVGGVCTMALGVSEIMMAARFTGTSVETV